MVSLLGRGLVIAIRQGRPIPANSDETLKVNVLLLLY